MSRCISLGLAQLIVYKSKNYCTNSPWIGCYIIIIVQLYTTGSGKERCCEYWFSKGKQWGYRVRGGEWYLEKRGSRKILPGSRNLGSVFDKSRSLVFSRFAFTFFESRNFSPKSLGLGFLTRISASWRVSDFTIRHP